MIETHNVDGLLAEVNGEHCRVHLQRGGEHWFSLILDDGSRRVMVSIGTPEHYRRKVNARIFSDTESTNYG